MGLGARDLGRLGEELAARHLTRLGWEILGRNVREGRKEIDIIARRDGVVAFVEVKTRRTNDFGDPLASISPGKRREIREVALLWLGRHRPGADTLRFDAVGVRLSPSGAVELEHVEDAWRD
jgi:putative endonuclease